MKYMHITYLPSFRNPFAPSFVSRGEHQSIILQFLFLKMAVCHALASSSGALLLAHSRPQGASLFPRTRDINTDTLVMGFSCIHVLPVSLLRFPPSSVYSCPLRTSPTCINTTVPVFFLYARRLCRQTAAPLPWQGPIHRNSNFTESKVFVRHVLFLPFSRAPDPCHHPNSPDHRESQYLVGLPNFPS